VDNLKPEGQAPVISWTRSVKPRKQWCKQIFNNGRFFAS